MSWNTYECQSWNLRHYDSIIFKMCATLLCTVTDFLAQSSLSGWNGQGYKVCPIYNEDTPLTHVKGKAVYFGHRHFYLWIIL